MSEQGGKKVTIVEAGRRMMKHPLGGDPHVESPDCRGVCSPVDAGGPTLSATATERDELGSWPCVHPRGCCQDCGMPYGDESTLATMHGPTHTSPRRCIAALLEKLEALRSQPVADASQNDLLPTPRECRHGKRVGDDCGLCELQGPDRPTLSAGGQPTDAVMLDWLAKNWPHLTATSLHGNFYNGAGLYFIDIDKERFAAPTLREAIRKAMQHERGIR